MTFRLGSTRSAMTFMLLLSFVSLTLLHATPALSRALCGPMDMAIVLDNTSSMGGAIDNVKAALPTIISDAKNASDGDLRLGYITFRDTVTILDPLTTDIAAVQASIEDEFASGGDGYPEASDEAMNTAVNNMAERPGQTGGFIEPWRDEAVKILILITDAEPGGFDDTFDAGVDDASMHTHAETARRKGILISSIFVPTGEDYADRIHPSPILEDQARTTGGGYIETSIDGVGTADAIKAIITGCGRFSERFLKPEPIAAVAGRCICGRSLHGGGKIPKERSR